MSVRAKFVVSNIETFNTSDGVALKNVYLHAVYGGSPENETFFNATPSGQIQLASTNAAATEQFEIGKEFYVDFTQAD